MILLPDKKRKKNKRDLIRKSQNYKNLSLRKKGHFRGWYYQNEVKKQLVQMCTNCHLGWWSQKLSKSS